MSFISHSIAVKNPFPAASTNLHKTLNKVVARHNTRSEVMLLFSNVKFTKYCNFVKRKLAATMMHISQSSYATNIIFMTKFCFFRDVTSNMSKAELCHIFLQFHGHIYLVQGRDAFLYVTWIRSTLKIQSGILTSAEDKSSNKLITDGVNPWILHFSLAYF